MVQANRECIEIPQRIAQSRRLAVHYNWDFLLGNAAMGAQGFLQGGEIMLALAGADHLGVARHHDQIAEPVLGQLELTASRLPVMDLVNTFQRRDPVAKFAPIHALGQIDGREGAERRHGGPHKGR